MIAEVELIDPELFFRYHPEAIDRLVTAIIREVRTPQTTMPTPTPIPRFSVPQAQHIAQRLYDKPGVICPLPSYIDQNFHLVSDNGDEYVLKIANPATDPAELDFEIQAMAYLSKTIDEYTFPRVIESVSGKTLEITEDESKSRFFVRLLSFLPGIFLADAKPHASSVLRGVGRMLGKIDSAFEQFSHPASNRTLNWDIKRAQTVIENYLPLIKNEADQALIETFSERFESQVVPKLNSLRSSVIHNDANDYNVLVDEHSKQRVIGIIDFGDMVKTYTVSEVAIGAAYALLHKGNPLLAAQDVLRGYHPIYPLEEAESDVLFDLICIRLCVSVCMSANEKAQHLDNDYIEISERPAWKALNRLQKIDPWDAQHAFREACQ